MASKTLSEIAGGGGGQLKLVAFEAGQISSGSSGDILSVTAGEGQFLKVTHLACSGFGSETNITLTINSVNIFSGQALTGNTSSCTAGSNSFGISNGYGDTTVSKSAKLLNSSELCTSFTVTKDSGTTSQVIDFAYETLEAI
jgi:hypothetical protein